MPGPRGEYRKSAQRREEILDAAFEVFSRSGYAASSVSEIARTVGMTQTGLLHHFDGKLALLQAVLERRDRDAREVLEGRRGVEWLAGLLEINRRNTGRRGVVQLYAILAAEATVPDHPARPYFVDRFAVIVDATERAFVQCREDGVLRPGVDPRQTAVDTVSLTEGAQLLWLSDLPGVDVLASVRRCIAAALTVPF
ncbi:TetR/AcrR family transcriptional regulator [Kineococcus rubinsiae]|uniref:TetR/AcrR family transcriptional regulator n=1 Tax=Kineococcus rubinsiae TaxID=2609562 RepID=UPI00142FBE92|nr:TetR/AcrR family transcriptional regulator [Kineococcus rubinsiae]